MVVASVSLLVAVLAGLLIKQLFLRQFQVDGSSRLLRSIVALLLLIGVALTVNSSVTLNKKMSRRYWPTVKGRIISAEIVGGTTYRPQIIYEFEVEGTIIRDTSDLDAPGFGGKNSRLDVAVAWIDRYPQGSDVTVHYDPGKPGNSSIRLSLGWDNLGKLGLGMTLVIVNLVVMMSLGRRSNSNQQRVT